MHVHVLYIHIHISSFILNSAFGFEHIASVCACVCVCVMCLQITSLKEEIASMRENLPGGQQHKDILGK